jgi:transposase InsO family protein
MADKVVGMDVRALVVVFEQDPARGAVTRFCREHGVSRSWFYELRARAAAEGVVAALSPRPRDPGKRSPLAISVAIEEAAVLLRKELADAGWDHGPVTVAHHLAARGLPAPAPSTLARVFTRRGLVTAQPQKRPRSATRRFEFAMVHQCWQLDSFVWPLTDGSNAAVYQLEDDRSRFVIASLAERGETSAGAVRVVDCGIAAFQVPQVLLTDNGSAFNATRRGSRSRLVEHLTLLGVQCITGRPGHPQTQGKNERIHQSTQRWLRAQPRAGSIAQLQAQIEQFDDYYNHHRPHQSLRMRTPAQALADGPVAIAPIPPPRPLDPPGRRDRTRAQAPTGVLVQPRRVDAKGKIRVRTVAILLGCEYAHTSVTVLHDEHHVEVFDAAGTHIRSQHLEPGKRYYSNGRPKTYRPGKP